MRKETQLGTLLHAIRDRLPLPVWATPPNLFPLPRGPYPATPWPKGAGAPFEKPAGGAK